MSAYLTPQQVLVPKRVLGQVSEELVQSESAWNEHGYRGNGTSLRGQTGVDVALPGPEPDSPDEQGEKPLGAGVQGALSAPGDAGVRAPVRAWEATHCLTPADADDEELDRFFEALEAMDDKGWSQRENLADPETYWRAAWDSWASERGGR